MTDKVVALMLATKELAHVYRALPVKHRSARDKRRIAFAQDGQVSEAIGNLHLAANHYRQFIGQKRRELAGPGYRT